MESKTANALEVTPRFSVMVQAAKTRDEATREACSIRHAMGNALCAIPNIQVLLAGLNREIPRKLALRSLLKAKQSEILKLRAAKRDYLQSLRDNRQVLPVLKEMLDQEEGRRARAERTLDLFERYRTCKQILCKSTSGRTPEFAAAWWQLEKLAKDLGPECEEDRQVFAGRMKAERPADFWPKAWVTTGRHRQ